MANAGTIVTLSELKGAGDSKAAFVKDAIDRHRRSELYRNAVSADMYYAQRNETVLSFVKMLFTVDGREMADPTASRIRMASNLFCRLNNQRCMYSLGRGVSFSNVDQETGEDTTKAALGPRFDDDIKAIGLKALIHGISFPFWNLDHLDVFDATEFCPIWDEHSGALAAGIRFWRLDSYHPLNAVLYEEDGYTEYVAESDGNEALHVSSEKRPYKVEYHEVPADGMKLAVDGENYRKLPIIPIWGSDKHQSTIVGMRSHIDAYDLIKSGLANDVQDCAEIYWIVENAGGMTDRELSEYRDRLKLTHIATANTEDGSGIRPYSQEVPYASRTATLDRIKSDLYEDFGALDVHTISAGATNDHIDAAYQPMDEEADEFERHMREGIQDILALIGIEDTPIFSRNRISNHKEQVEVISMEAEWLDEETILRKLPNVTPDEVREILSRRNEEDDDRMANVPGATEGTEAQEE